jgi:hypothetical protein
MGRESVLHDHHTTDDSTEEIARVVLLSNSYNPDELYRDEAERNDGGILLRTIIHVSDSSQSLLLRRLSQTPLLPSTFIELGEVPYVTAVSLELEKRVEQKAAATGLPDVYREAIDDHVAFELAKRIESNDKAGRRLLDDIEGVRLSDDEASLLWKVRTGTATMAETGELLLKYPSMQSIEAMKYTEPLDFEKIMAIEGDILRGLSTFMGKVNQPDVTGVSGGVYKNSDRLSRNPRFMTIRGRHLPEVGEFEEFDSEDDASRSMRHELWEQQKFQRDYELQKQALIVGLKENLGEFTVGETTIQLVQKLTMVTIPPSLHLDGVQANIQSIPGFPVANYQPIARTLYWRVKPQAQ